MITGMARLFEEERKNVSHPVECILYVNNVFCNNLLKPYKSQIVNIKDTFLISHGLK